MTDAVDLVRVAEAPHEGLVVCAAHHREVAVELAYEKLPEAESRFWGHRCVMCLVDPAPGRSCENAACKKPLHPRWPAVYCCNACALEDA